MNTIGSRWIGMGVFFLLIFLSGFWLSRNGRPYSPAFFNVHKMIALSAVVVFGLMIYRSHQAAPLQAVQIAAIAATAVLLLATIITGGISNLEVPAFVRRVHHVTPYLSVAATVITFYLLFGRQAFRLPIS